MNMETRNCKNCQSDFTIEPEDFAFYEKMNVPPPTFCPECRMVRRFIWRNERTLHKRKCSLCNEEIISLYSSSVTFPVYCHECWFSDKWNPMDFRRDYDFSHTFFEQFKNLEDSVPRIAIFNTQSINSEYTNQSYNNKNVYLSFALRDSEDSAYTAKNVGIKYCFDTTYTHHSEYIYEGLHVDKSYGSKYIDESEGCVDSLFLSNAKNCQNCIGGVNLRSISSYIFGEKLSKDEFLRKRESLNIGSYRSQKNLENKFSGLKNKAIYKFSKFTNCTNCEGDHLSNSRNCHEVFDGFDLDNARYSSWVFHSKDISDAFGMGGSERIYEAIGVEEVNNIKFANINDTSHDVQYTDLCSSSSNLFACIGLRNKSYCILNKQYTKEEYEALIPRIIQHMNDMPYIDKKSRVYRYGEFFPPELSPFSYNETIAQEYFPLTKEEATRQGYSWKDPEPRNYQITLKTEGIPDHIKDVPDSILNDIIQCAHHQLGHSVSKCNEQCTEAFRIISSELDFLRKQNLPLPRLCPNCRHYQRIKQRNPLKLWHRTCMCKGSKNQPASPAGGESPIKYQNTAKHEHADSPCPNEFETSYAPERSEIVYCEECYLKEVV